VPTASVDTKILEDSIHLTAPARDIDYATSLALGWPVKPDKGEATYEFGLLRIEVPFKDPMGDAVKVVIKAGGSGTKIKKLQADASVNHRETGARQAEKLVLMSRRLSRSRPQGNYR
jgi:hypothetical protein